MIVFWKFLRFGCGALLFPKLKMRFFVKKSHRKKRPGERLCGFLEHMGPSFVKFGQILSMRADLLGEEMTQDLSRLLDRLEPFSAEIAKKIIEDDFARPLEEIFEEFSLESVSAASVAQVHKAKLNGKDVAVKILRPNIRERFLKDMKLFYSLHKLANRFFSKRVERLSLEKVLKVFADTIDRETNLLLEGASAQRLRKESADLHQVEIPKVFWEATSERCLTTEWMDGVALGKLTKLDKKLASKILIHALFYQAIRNGFFHGDLHSGNIFFNVKRKKLILVDFGIMSWLSMDLRIFLVKIFRGSIRGDYKMVAMAHQEMGLFQKPVCMETFTLACSALISPLVGLTAKEISCSKLLTNLMGIAESFQVKLQPELLLLNKTLISAEGIARQLDSDINVWSISGEVIEDWIKENHRSFKAFKNRAKTHMQKLAELLNWIEDMPKRN